MHTFEHLFATYARNSAFSDQIIYVGPVGCRTGFYFLTRDAMSGEQAIALVRECFAFIAAFEGKIPGSERKECGNYLEHDLPVQRLWRRICARFWSTGPSPCCSMTIRAEPV